jgi:hypothetical protein
MEGNQKKLVIALASALGAALIAIAFLLGRISSSPTVVTVAVPARNAPTQAAADVPAPSAPASTDPRTSSEAKGSGEAPTVTLKIPENLSLPGALETSGAGASTPAFTASSDRPQIVAYFAEIDRLQEMGDGTDPQSFANTLVQSMSSGDFSGFDDLLAKARTQRQKLQAITPPPACASHHRLAVTLSGDSVAMLERVKAAMVKGDTTALLSISTDGKNLQAQADQLKTLEATIKRQAGI